MKKLINFNILIINFSLSNVKKEKKVRCIVQNLILYEEIILIWLSSTKYIMDTWLYVDKLIEKYGKNIFLLPFYIKLIKILWE